jgi:hypothetical protein
MKQIVFILLLISCVFSIKRTQYAVGLIEATYNSNQDFVDISWLDIDDKNARYKIYRHTNIIDSEQVLKSAECISLIIGGIQKFRDTLPGCGKFYYAVTSVIAGVEIPVLVYAQSFTWEPVIYGNIQDIKEAERIANRIVEEESTPSIKGFKLQGNVYTFLSNIGCIKHRQDVDISFISHNPSNFAYGYTIKIDPAKWKFDISGYSFIIRYIHTTTNNEIYHISIYSEDANWQDVAKQLRSKYTFVPEENYNTAGSISYEIVLQSGIIINYVNTKTTKRIVSELKNEF